MMKKISIIVAMSDNSAIGQDNALLWHLPNDLKHFKALTIGKPMIMGRKTYDSIGKPLPGRQTVVLTRQTITIPGTNVVHTVEEALAVCGDAPEIMVVGGGEIYHLFLPMATCLYITYVHVKLVGEVSFPYFEAKAWREISQERFYQDEKHAYDYSFCNFNETLNIDGNFISFIYWQFRSLYESISCQNIAPSCPFASPS